jgi:ketosteroid isomerase-like protein
MTNDPAQTVRDYLAAMERRDLAAAKAMLAPDFFMLFPGGKRFETLEALVEWAKPRYRRALKTYDRFDAAPQSDGSAVVYCFGTLNGELNDGTPYSGIRFIDRFTVRDGRLADQMVWNDMGEVLGRLG